MPGVVVVALVGLWIYCLYDVITTDRELIRNLPKLAWLAIVFLVPAVGPIAWLMAGRPAGAGLPFRRTDGERPGAPAPRRENGAEAVELDGMSAILREREERSRLRMLEAQLRRREEELRNREKGSPE